jgi:DNA-binding Xre family transcriptional regulator
VSNGGRKDVSKLDAQVGEIVKALRQDKGKTDAALAPLVGLNEASLCRLQNGMQRWSLDSLVAVCRVLGVRASDVLARAKL